MIDVTSLRTHLPDDIGVAVVDSATGNVVSIDRGPHADLAMTRAAAGMTTAMLALDEASEVLGVGGPSVTRATDGDRTVVGLRDGAHVVVGLCAGSAEGRLQTALVHALSLSTS